MIRYDREFQSARASARARAPLEQRRGAAERQETKGRREVRPFSFNPPLHPQPSPAPTQPRYAHRETILTLMFGTVSEAAFQEVVLITLAQKNRLIYEAALTLLSLRNEGDECGVVCKRCC